MLGSDQALQTPRKGAQMEAALHEAAWSAVARVERAAYVRRTELRTLWAARLSA